MEEKSSRVVVPVAESASPCMPKQAVVRTLTSFSLAEIKQLIYQGRPIYKSTCLDVKALQTGRPLSKILVITPRKIGSAPQRNLIKRRLRSLFYEERLYTCGYNLAFFCKKGSADLSFSDIKKVLLTCYATLGVPPCNGH